MIKSGKMLAGLIFGVIVVTSGGLAFALDQDSVDNTAEQRLAQACERAVITKTPSGQRDMETFSYEEESKLVGVVKGGLKTRLKGNRWSQVNWNCRINPTSGRVLRAEFAWPGNGSRLLAAASHLRE